jgi:hypothetical protein
VAIEARKNADAARKIRLGMVGGGEGAFIGGVHRFAARLDDQYELVAGALASNPEKAQRSGVALGLASDRIYPDFETMARTEGARRWYRRGIDRDAESHACAGCRSLSQGWHSCHL